MQPKQMSLGHGDVGISPGTKQGYFASTSSFNEFFTVELKGLSKKF
jgi:hypothetical protein